MLILASRASLLPTDHDAGRALPVPRLPTTKWLELENAMAL